MSNQDVRNTGTNRTTTPDSRTWKQKHGATLMIAVFALLAIVMVLMEKRAAH
jgi:hypothetical protein